MNLLPEQPAFKNKLIRFLPSSYTPNIDSDLPTNVAQFDNRLCLDPAAVMVANAEVAKGHSMNEGSRIRHADMRSGPSSNEDKAMGTRNRDLLLELAKVRSERDSWKAGCMQWEKNDVAARQLQTYYADQLDVLKDEDSRLQESVRQSTTNIATLRINLDLHREEKTNLGKLLEATSKAKADLQQKIEACESGLRHERIKNQKTEAELSQVPTREGILQRHLDVSEAAFRKKEVEMNETLAQLTEASDTNRMNADTLRRRLQSSDSALQAEKTAHQQTLNQLHPLSGGEVTGDGAAYHSLVTAKSAPSTQGSESQDTKLLLGGPLDDYSSVREERPKGLDVCLVEHDPKPAPRNGKTENNETLAKLVEVMQVKSTNEATLQQRLDAAEDFLQHERSESARAIAELQDMLNAKTSDRATLQQRLVDVQSALLSIKSDNANLSREAESTKAALDAARKFHRQMAKSSTEQDLEEMRKTNIDMAAILRASEIEFGNLKIQLAIAKCDLRRVRDEVNELTHGNVRLHGSLRDQNEPQGILGRATTKSNQVPDESSHLKKRLADMNTLVRNLRKSEGRFQDRNKAMETDMEYLNEARWRAEAGRELVHDEVDRLELELAAALKGRCVGHCASPRRWNGRDGNQRIGSTVQDLSHDAVPLAASPPNVRKLDVPWTASGRQPKPAKQSSATSFFPRTRSDANTAASQLTCRSARVLSPATIATIAGFLASSDALRALATMVLVNRQFHDICLPVLHKHRLV